MSRSHLTNNSKTIHPKATSTMRSTDNSNKTFTNISNSTISNNRYRSAAVHYISSLLTYSMKKRKLESERDQEVPSANRCAGIQGSDAQCPKRIRATVSRDELRAIQMQLIMLSDEDGDRSIHVAVANENIRLVHKLCRLMIKNSVSLDITNYMRQTPLHLAVILGNAEITRLLLSFGASPVVSDRNGNSVLHLAVKSNRNKDVLRILLSHPQVKNVLNAMDYEGYSALHYAALKNNSDAVKMLQEFGADMNRIDGKSGRTALIHAVLEQNTDMVELLLNCGSCPQKGDYSGRSAFEMALQIANIQIIKLLEKKMPQNDVSAIKEQMMETGAKAAKRIKRNKD